MSMRKSRRAVMAEVLLLANPRLVHETRDSRLYVTFDTISELRAWLDDAGLNGPSLVADEYTGTEDDGRTFRSLTAWPTWHGWKVSATATEYVDPPVLDVGTVEGLATVAVAG